MKGMNKFWVILIIGVVFMGFSSVLTDKCHAASTDTPTYTYTPTPVPPTNTPTYTPTFTITPTFTPTIDLTPPSLSLNAPSGYQTSSYNVSWNVTDAGVGVKSVLLSRNLTPVSTAISGAVLQDFPTGAYNYQLSASDHNNNAASMEKSVAVDKTPPSVWISSPVNNQATNVPNISIQAGSSDVGSYVWYIEVYLNEIRVAEVQNSSVYYTVQNLQPGNNSIKCIAYDYASNASTPAIINVIYDPPPVITVSSYQDPVYTDTIQITINVTDAGGSNIASVSIDDQNGILYDQTYSPNSSSFSTTYTWHLIRGDNDGVNQLSISASDGLSYTSILTNVTYLKQWTCIFLAAGDNARTSEIWSNVLELQNVGSDVGQLDIFVLYDGVGTDDTKLYHVQSGSMTELSWSTEENMGSSSTLQNYLNYIIPRYPSDHYWLNINGDVGSGDGRVVLTDKGDSLTLSEMKSALDNANADMDVISLDTSLMASMECLAAVRNHTDYLVASQEILPADGFDYDGIINVLKWNLDNSANFCTQFVNNYRTQYASIPDVCLTAINANSSLYNYFDTFAGQISQKSVYSIKYPIINNAKKTVHRADQTIATILNRDLADLYGFAQQLNGHIVGADSIVDNFASARIAHWKSSVNTNLVNANGISVYLPDEPTEYDAGYSTTPLAQTQWDEFVRQDITPPQIVSLSLTGTTITNLGDSMELSFGGDEDCSVKIAYSDASGSIDYGTVEETIALNANQTMSKTLYGNIGVVPSKKLLNNGTYYLKVTLEDVAGNSADFITSNALVMDIARKTVAVSAKTPQQVKTGYQRDISTAQYKILIQHAIGDLNNASVPRTAVPLSGQYTMEVSKTGYRTSTITGLDGTMSTFACIDFRPYMYGESGYDDSVDSDGDAISDGWEYKYWIDWWGDISDAAYVWTSACGCDLTNGGDANADQDVLYNYQDRRSVKGDGLTNLEEYRLSQHFPALDPSKIDLCIELDWIYGSSTRNYQPSAETKTKAETIFMNAGIKVHWAASQSASISISEATAEQPTVSLSTLHSWLAGSKGSYSGFDEGNDIDIIHVLFAPGYTVVTGLPNSPSVGKSIGGLYIPDGDKNKCGVIVFDLHSRNLNSRVQELKSNSELDKHEATILGHEIGHVLDLEDFE